MASGSLKDTVKALNVAFSSPSGIQSASPISPELKRALEAYLVKYGNIDDDDSERLQEELRGLHSKTVSQDPRKRALFLAVLRQLRPAILGESRLEEWWHLEIKPALDGVAQKRTVIEDAQDFLLGILVYDEETEGVRERAKTSARFRQKLLDAYLAKTVVATDKDEVVSPENEFVARQLEDVIVAFGRKKPKDLLHAIDDLVVKTETRLQALSLLCAVLRHQPPHLYLVAQTPLIEHLLKCLMNDTSTTAISIALTCLIMFLPHIPSSIAEHLPRLFLIYSRILCWEKFSPSSTDAQRNAVTDDRMATDETKRPYGSNIGVDETWDTVSSSFESAESTTPELMHYFTYLYGLYPLNFMSYIRKPRKYLKNVEFPGADDFDLDQAVIRRRTEQFRQCHLLHPNFYNTTLEEELSENHWLMADAADVVAECTSLCLAITSTPVSPGPPPVSSLPALPPPHSSKPPTLPASPSPEDLPQRMLANLSEAVSPKSSYLNSATDYRPQSSWRNTQSTAAASQGTEPDSPTLGPLNARSEADSGPGNGSRRGSRISYKSSLGVATSDTLSLDNLPQPGASGALRTPAVRPGPPTESNIAYLQREVMLLRNDLNFERYLKQQHLSHIGQLQRKHIKEATVEAETMNLINTNRALSKKLADANRFNETLKKETTTGRNQSKKFEAELSSKVRSLREEQKLRKANEDNLRLQLQKAQNDCEALLRLQVEFEARELLSQQKLKTLELDLEQLEKLRREVRELRDRVHVYERRDLDYLQAKEEAEALRGELDTANLIAQSQDQERERSKRAFSNKIAELESRIQPVNGHIPPHVQAQIDSTIQLARARYDSLKKTYTRLLHKYTELEMELQELKGEQAAARGLRVTPSFDHEDDRSSSMFASHNSLGVGSANQTASPFQRHQGLLDINMDKNDYLDIDSHSPPSSAFGGPSQSFPSQRPHRYEAFQARPPPSSPSKSEGSAIDPNMLQSWNATPPLTSSEIVQDSSRSAFSVESGSHKSDRSKSKIQPKSEVRVYGRGGAQNIKMKTKDEEKAAAKPQKSGVLRGLKGIM
ncbi:hypothetical protein LTR66_000761 [Elasticomyces elasticus]|nr:hypothetical protein LTR66_000761 [Elasticomyces elasticus]